MPTQHKKRGPRSERVGDWSEPVIAVVRAELLVLPTEDQPSPILCQLTLYHGGRWEVALTDEAGEVIDGILEDAEDPLPETEIIEKAMEATIRRFV